MILDNKTANLGLTHDLQLLSDYKESRNNLFKNINLNSLKSFKQFNEQVNEDQGWYVKFLHDLKSDNQHNKAIHNRSIPLLPKSQVKSMLKTKARLKIVPKFKNPQTNKLGRLNKLHFLKHLKVAKNEIKKNIK